MALISILENMQNQSVSLLTNNRGSFNFDAVTVEQHASKLKITENPVENGTNVADHAVLEPKEVTINGVIVGYTPPLTPISDKIGDDNLAQYLLPIEVRTISAALEQQVNDVVATYQTVSDRQNKSPVADFLTDNSLAVNSVSSDRVANAYETLLLLQRSGEPVSLLTNAKLYKNMLLISIQLNQKNRMSGEFALVFREIFIVETKKINGINSSTRNLGRTQPQKVADNRSFLKWFYSLMSH